MPIIFNDSLRSSSGGKLLEDIFIQGNLKIVPDVIARDALSASLLKIGSLVRTRDTGLFWRVNNLTYSYNDDGEEVVIVDWQPFKFGADVTNSPEPVTETAYTLKHNNFSISLKATKDSKPIAYTLNLGCYSFFLLNLRVSQPIKVEIYSRKDMIDRSPYTFIAKPDHLIDNGDSFVKKKGSSDLVINTSAYSIIANEDDVLEKKFYFRLTPMTKLTANGKYDPDVVTVAFDYIPIET